LEVSRIHARNLRAGITVEWLTIGWMTVETVVSIGAGIVAGSVALLAFGIDSVIELVSGGVLLWRLRVEQDGAQLAAVERAEHLASKIVGWSLVALAVYVVGHAGYALVVHAEPDSSPLGIAVAAAALLVMPMIVRTKRRVAATINSPALEGDAACGVVCAYMAGTLLVGLGLRAIFGWWWADPVAALGLVYFIAREAREALISEHGCGCACEH
jgi:divalent metal cation (Fe/Co/Zn/Cd) transporter